MKLTASILVSKPKYSECGDVDILIFNSFLILGKSG
jgi:hypothetical protein